MRRITSLVLFLLLLSATARDWPAQALSPQTQLILNPTAMAWVSSAEANTNFGGQDFMWVGYGHGTGGSLSALRGLVQFDLSTIPAGATITGAHLYATIWGAQGPDDHFPYCPGSALAAWDETIVTWNNKPGMLGGGICTDISATAGQNAWDLTTVVQEMQAGLRSNHGFYLTRVNDDSDPQEHARLFDSLQLLVTYETPTPTPTPVAPLPLTITKSDHVDPVYAGDEIVYTISVRNMSDQPLQNVVLEDTIPEGTTFVEATSGGTFADGTITWEIPSLYMGATFSVDLTLRTLSTLADGTLLTNRATVGYFCPSQSGEAVRICSQETTETTTVNQRPQRPPTPITCLVDGAGDTFGTATDLPLGPAGIIAFICPAGDEDWFKFPVAAGDTIDGLLYNLPANYAAELWRPDGGHQATFNHEGLADEPIQWWGITTAQAGEWRVRIYGMAGAYAAAPYQLSMQVHPPAPTPTPTDTPAPTPTPTPTATATSIPSPRLDLSLTLSRGEPVPGEDVTYSIWVTNTGTVPATDIRVHDSYPYYTTFQSASPTPESVSSQTILWPVVQNLNPGASFRYRVTLRIWPDVPGEWPLENEAFVTAPNLHTLYAQHSVIVHEIPDLTIADARVIQAITPGDLAGVDTPIPMIEGKYTVVRVAVRSTHAQDNPVPGVTGRLHYYHPGEDVHVIEPDNGPIAASPQPAWGNNDDTLNFFIPTDYLHGEVRWWVEINTDHRVRERDYTNNRWPADPDQKKVIQFRPARTYRIGYVPIAWAATDTDTKRAPSTRIETADWFLNRAFPLDLTRTDYYEAGMSGAAAMTWEGDDWDALIAELNNYWDMLELYTSEGAPDQLVGWLPDWTCEYGGLAPSDGAVVSIVNDDPNINGVIMAHEIGHNLWLDHPLSDAIGDNCTVNEDPDWPYGLDKSVQTMGFDPYESHFGSGQGVVPASTDEFMTGGHCAGGRDPKWISPYTFKKLIDPLTPIPLVAASASALTATAGQRVLLVNIAVRDDGIELFPAQQVTVPQTVTLPRPRPGQDYCVALRDAGGTDLEKYCFALPRQATGWLGADTPPVFSVPLVYHGNTAELIAYEQAGPRQAQRLVSANDPQITALFPNGGETLTQPITATWQAADPDGDPLTYAVLYSADDGAHWRPLVTGLKTLSFVLDPATLPGSEHARLRIIATDGIRTVGRDSQESFVVPTKPPQARILTPKDGAEVLEGAPVSFFGRGFDREDGIIRDDAAYAWHSSLDGPLGSGRSLELDTLSPGHHTITLTLTDSDGRVGRDSIIVTVVPSAPPPCTGHQLLSNGDFETGNLNAWRPGGGPRPAVVSGEKHGGDYALLVGNPAQQPQRPTLSFVRQYVRVPADATEATLTFWYKVRASDPGQDYDWFGAYVLDPTGERTHGVVKENSNTGWKWATYNVTEFRGQAIGIGFFVRNDGQGGTTWAFVDDVTLCTDGTLPSAPEQGTCWLPDSLPDYAPAGLPDFDQRQSTWQTPGTEQWSHDGPAALADLLWWRDAAEEPGATIPPAIADGYGLVRAYGAWDDHDPQNVPRLVADLATRMATDRDHPGTDLDDLIAGLNTYLGSMGLADDTTLTLRRVPSFDWVREEVKQQRQVLLLLGFWELQPGGWRRLGGHYVAVAGTSCTGDGITFSDPFRDYAELGWPGQMIPPTSHAHPATPPDAIHNDAAFVSHDTYGIMRTATAWGPQGYARQYGDIANFAGLNFAPALEAARAPAYLGGEIATLVDYALVLSPGDDATTLSLAPAINHVRQGETFLVEMRVSPGLGTVDSARAFLDFDPTRLQVVDAEGNPAAAILPGSTLATVSQNHVNNSEGHISYVATGEAATDPFPLAVVRFKAISTTLDSALTWSLDAPRRSDLLAGGDSVMTRISNGRVSILPGAAVVGRASLQGRPTPPDPAWRTPMLLTFSRPHEVGSAYLFGTASNDSGRFLAPGILAPSDYRVRIKSLHSLRNLLPTTLSPGGNALNLETLLEGDALGDNRIDVRDVSLLARSYGTSQGETGFDARTDFNQDGTVDQADVALLQANLGRRGDVLVGATSAAASTDALTVLLTPNTPTTATVSLSLIPASASVAMGDVTVLDVVAEAGAQAVDAVQVYLDYDPAALQLVDASGRPATALEPGSALPMVFMNTTDPARGRIGYIASSLGASPASGQFVVARLRLKALQPGPTWVRFSTSDWRPTDASYQGASVLKSLTAATIVVPQPLLYLPMTLK